MDIILMHKDNPVIQLNIDFDGTITKVGKVLNPNLLPVSVQGNVYDIKTWLFDRAIPKTRSGIATVLNECGVPSTQSLLIKNLGLSLTDNYWLKPINSEYTWSSVNLFTNSFHPAMMYYDMGEDSLGFYLNLSPNSSLKGELKKKWFIDERNVRVLVKGNYGEGCQQSLNEEFATAINKLQGWKESVKYTVKPYKFEGQSQAFCCFSDNFIKSDDEEFIPGWEIFKYTKCPNNVSSYNHFINNAVLLGLDRQYVIEFLSYQILIDYAITNVDRHFNNFGVIRDTTTLKLKRMAPIYDFGNSMFYDQLFLSYKPKIIDRIEVNSFRKKEISLLEYVADFNSFDVSRIPTDSEIISIYNKDKTLEQERLEYLLKCFHYKISKIEHRQVQQGLVQLNKF